MRPPVFCIFSVLCYNKRNERYIILLKAYGVYRMGGPGPSGEEKWKISREKWP